MNFVYPSILWALGALSIPIIVHLFNFRRFKKVLFPNVSFLKEIKQETQSKSRLKHLLILASRLLAIAAIVLAFAQPFIPTTQKAAVTGNRAVGVYIDNSFSMEAEHEGGMLLELARNKAFEIVNAFAPSDKFQLLTNDFEGRHLRLVSREEMTDLIHEIQISPKSRKISETFSRLRDGLNSSGIDNKTAFLLTDLQKSSTDLEDLENDTTIQLRLVPSLASTRSNLFIDSVWFDTPVRLLNQPEALNVRIGNSSADEKNNIPLSLRVNGEQKSVATVNVPANSKADVELTFSNTGAGIKQCIVSIDDHPVSFDNQFYFSFDVAEQILVTNIGNTSGASGPVATLFSEDPYFRYAQMSAANIDFGELQKQNLVVLDQLIEMSSGLQSELEKFVNAGGSIFIVPAPEADVVSYNNLLSKLGSVAFSEPLFEETKVNTINYQHPVYSNLFEKNKQDVDLPEVSAFYPMTVSSRSVSEPLMTLQNGYPFLISTDFGGGRVFVSAVSLSKEVSNFTAHALFPATLLCVAEYSRSTSPLYYNIGQDETISMDNLSVSGEESLRLRNIQTNDEFIPRHSNMSSSTDIFVKEEMKQDGNYLLSLGDSVLSTLSFNYNRVESHTESYSVDELKKNIVDLNWVNATVIETGTEGIRKGAIELNEGRKLWWTCIVWALIFLAVEVLLIKFWR
ncbi:MAG: BatA domain-containing protein [Flavobacteriales bacterium]|nr:BatA domain-containing protein [Flavobacteriales bacterium]